MYGSNNFQLLRRTLSNFEPERSHCAGTTAQYIVQKRSWHSDVADVRWCRFSCTIEDHSFHARLHQECTRCWRKCGTKTRQSDLMLGLFCGPCPTPKTCLSTQAVVQAEITTLLTEPHTSNSTWSNRARTACRHHCCSTTTYKMIVLCTARVTSRRLSEVRSFLCHPIGVAWCSRSCSALAFFLVLDLNTNVEII